MGTGSGGLALVGSQKDAFLSSGIAPAERRWGRRPGAAVSCGPYTCWAWICTHVLNPSSDSRVSSATSLIIPSLPELGGRGLNEMMRK